MDWIRVAPEGELPPGSAVSVETDFGFVAVFNIEGRFYAIDDLCPHVAERLSQGHVDGCIVSCPGHGWRFDVRTGRSPDFEGIQVARFEVEVADGVVYLVPAGDALEWEGASDPDDIDKPLFD
jgi:nitrite reductase/ring-hydroxylating ferredoxin subunit